MSDEKRLIQTPATELKELRSKRHTVKKMVINSKEEQLKDVNGDMMEIIAEFETGSAKAFGLKVRQSDDGKEAITIRYNSDILNVAGTEVPLDLVLSHLYD